MSVSTWAPICLQLSPAFLLFESFLFLLTPASVLFLLMFSSSSCFPLPSLPLPPPSLYPPPVSSSPPSCSLLLCSLFLFFLPLCRLFLTSHLILFFTTTDRCPLAHPPSCTPPRPHPTHTITTPPIISFEQVLINNIHRHRWIIQQRESWEGETENQGEKVGVTNKETVAKERNKVRACRTRQHGTRNDSEKWGVFEGII